jgi:hypothetical protein
MTDRKTKLLMASHLLGCIGLCGCGNIIRSAGDSGATVLHGSVHGGQQPVSGSTIQLYTAGSAGNGSAATAMLTETGTTAADGSFSIAVDHPCGQAGGGTSANAGNNQVYIVATGGNAGLGAGTNNSGLVLMAALGACGALSSTTNIALNEVTTVAAAWALAPFMKSATQAGASSSNAAGISNGFLDAQLLANTATGAAAVLGSGLSVETGKLYALADALASCVNSAGGSACAPLFNAATPMGGAPPADTLGAALNIVKNPGQNVAAVFNAIGPSPAYPTSLSKPPNDWTMSLTVTGGGLNLPTALDIDKEGVVWVASETGGVSAFSPQGSPVSATAYGATVTEQSFGLTIDTSGDIWVTNYNAPYNAAGAVTEFLGTNSGSPGSVVLNNGNAGFYDSSLQYPFAVAADTNGNIFVANNGSSSATVYSGKGALVAPGLGENLGLEAFPQAIAVDASHGFWLPDSNYRVDHVSALGALLSTTVCCDDSYGLATDSYGNVWVANYLGQSVSEVTSSGALAINQASVGGLYYPSMVAVDAAQNVWVTNRHSGSISEIAGNSGTVLAGTNTALPPGTGISPAVGTYGTGGYGLDSGLNLPYGIVPDGSGNVWVSDNGAGNKIVMFFGLATPTATPVMPTPVAP